jgi:hypothetical protein
MRYFACNSLQDCLLRAATVPHTLLPLLEHLQALFSSVSAPSCLPLLLLQRGLRGYTLLTSSITTKRIHSIASSYNTALYSVRYFAYNSLQDCLLRVTRQSCSSCGRDTGLYCCLSRAQGRRENPHWIVSSEAELHQLWARYRPISLPIARPRPPRSGGVDVAIAALVNVDPSNEIDIKDT